MGPEELAIPLFEMVVGGLGADLAQMAVHRSHIGVDGHAVVIQDHDQRLPGGAGVVEPLIGKAPREGPVPDQRQHRVVLAL